MIFKSPKTIFDNNFYKKEFFASDFFYSPDGDGIYPKHHCKVTFNLTKPFIKNYRNAIDIGCRDGEFTRFLQNFFQHTFCFDPRSSSRFPGNVDLEKVSHFKCALGDKEETITMTGGTHKIVLGRTYNTECFKLDDFEFEDIDFIKIDVEGFEKKVIQGAFKTILKYNPLLVIEQNDEILVGDQKFSAIKYLEQNFDYKVVAVCPRGFDFVMIKS